jgi:hypothetical protein
MLNTKEILKFQDLACEEKPKDRIYEVFQSWLEQTKLVVGCRKKPMHELEEFVWIWEVYFLPLLFDIDMFLLVPDLIIFYVLYVLEMVSLFNSSSNFFLLTLG